MTTQTATQCPVMNPRKLVAIDIVFLGSIFIIAEFVCGVVLCVVLGIFVLVRGSSFGQLSLGLYLISLGINYVPMLIYALVITKCKSARAELGDELNDERRAMAKCRRKSLLLLVPLLMPLVALGNEHRRHHVSPGEIPNSHPNRIHPKLYDTSANELSRCTGSKSSARE
jgi:hypothetical protein